MKKDKKFLEELASFLGESKYKDEIISKYDNLIKSEKANGKKIKYILKDIGDPETIAKNELKSYEKNNSFNVLNSIKDTFASLKEKTNIKMEEFRAKREERVIKKAQDKIVSDAQKEKSKEEKAKLKEEKRVEKEIKKLNKEEENPNKDKKNIFLTLKEKLNKEINIDSKNKKETKKKEKDSKQKNNKEDKKNIFVILKEKLSTKKNDDKSKKEVKKKDKKKEEKNNKDKVSFFESIKLKLASNKEKKNKDKKEKKEKVKEEKPKKEKVKKEKPKKEKVSFKDRFKNLFKKKEREVTNTPVEVVEEVKEEVEDKIGDVTEIVTESYVFESKGKRFKRVILKTIGVLITCIFAFIWLWVTVVFFASVFAYLDGIKFIGIVIAAFSVDLLIFWIVIMVNRAIFKKKMSLILNLIIVFISIAGIAYGGVKGFKEISAIEHIEDVSDKYTMTRKLETYDLSRDTNEKFIITFNSNYNTQYVVKYDKNLKNKVKIETRYYECYYDYYVKTNVNGVYVSLKLDDRDRFSVYLDDIKEGKIYDNDELARYTVKITVNPNDSDRIAIQ